MFRYNGKRMEDVVDCVETTGVNLNQETMKTQGNMEKERLERRTSLEVSSKLLFYSRLIIGKTFKCVKYLLTNNYTLSSLF